MLTVARTPVNSGDSDMPGLSALADLLRATIAALEAVAQREVAVAAIYQAGREDERAALSLAGT